jgi:hypothetical protein
VERRVRADGASRRKAKPKAAAPGLERAARPSFDRTKFAGAAAGSALIVKLSKIAPRQ